MRELWAFGGDEAREGSGIGARLGRAPGLTPESGDIDGRMLGVLSRSATGAAGGFDIGGLETAGVSSVGAARWISVRDSGAGGIAWISV